MTVAEHWSDFKLTKTPHSLTSRMSYGVSPVRILVKIDYVITAPEKIDHVIMAWHCIMGSSSGCQTLQSICDMFVTKTSRRIFPWLYPAMNGPILDQFWPIMPCLPGWASPCGCMLVGNGGEMLSCMGPRGWCAEMDGSPGCHGKLSHLPGQNGRHSAEDIYKCIFMNEKFCILISIPLKLVSKGPVDNKSALVQVRACRQTGDKPLPEPMMTQFTDAYMPCSIKGRWTIISGCYSGKMCSDIKSFHLITTTACVLGHP